MLRLPAYSSPTDLHPQAANAMSPSQVPFLGLALVAIGGFLLWRAAQRSNPSRQEERRGGIAFLVLGCLIGAAGVVNIWLD